MIFSLLLSLTSLLSSNALCVLLSIYVLLASLYYYVAEHVQCCLDSNCKNCVSEDSVGNCVQHYPYYMAHYGDSKCRAAKTGRY